MNASAHPRGVTHGAGFPLTNTLLIQGSTMERFQEPLVSLDFSRHVEVSAPKSQVHTSIKHKVHSQAFVFGLEGM